MGARYREIWKDGELFATFAGGELTYLNPSHQPAKRSELAMPMVIRDIGEYRSPIDGQMITSRNQHRDHLRAHDVVEVGNEKIGSLTPSVSTDTHDIGEQIKRRIEEVQALPQAVYDEHVKIQQAEHAQVASLVTA